MNLNEYQELALRTVNKDLDKRDLLINASMGICGEAGETIDIVKKHLGHKHELDREHIKEELGDIMWYIAEMCYVLEINLDDVCENNIAKLKKRYPEGFDYIKSFHK